MKEGNTPAKTRQALETTITAFPHELATEGEPKHADLVELFARTPPVIEPGAPTAKEPDGAKPKGRMPFVFPGKLRGNSRAAPVTPEKLTAIVLDFDKLSAEQIDQAFAILDGLGCRYAAHTTYSHNPEAGRHSWRVWVDVSRPMSPEEHAVTAEKLAAHFPKIDGSCTETPRGYYLPALRHEGAPYETRNGGTEPLPVLAVDLDDPALLGRKCPKGRSPRDHGVWLAQHAPPAVEGQGGHAALLSVCRALRWGLELSADDTRAIILDHYNPRCVPPFDFDGADRGQLDHKIESASQPFGGLASGYLLSEIEAVDVLTAARAHYVGSVEIGVGTPLFGELAKLEASGAPEIEELWSDLQDARYSRWQALRNATKKAAKQLERSAKRADGKPSVPVTHPEAQACRDSRARGTRASRTRTHHGRATEGGEPVSTFRDALERWQAEQGEGFDAVERRRSAAFERWSAEQAERQAQKDAERRAFELREATREPTQDERSVAAIKARFGIE